MTTQPEAPQHTTPDDAPREPAPEPRESGVIDDLDPYNLPFTD